MEWLEQMARLKVLCSMVTQSVLSDAPHHPANAAGGSALAREGS